MSTVIDQRVVEMTFDNSNFEKNVSTTMSTLDKLKLGIRNLTGEKAFDAISASARNVNLEPVSNAVEEVSHRFSAMEVIAVTALMNVTNSAINAGKKLVKSVTVDQITAGFSKYEQRTANVQTLVNATGKSVKEIEGYLNTLMWYSDETSYGFTDMTQALATMASTGGNIDKLVPMIMGVANATAYAGKGASEFSRIMQYSINQAYSLGHMQLQDWKSIEGATVGSKQLQQILISAGEELGKIKKGQVTVNNFRDTLKKGWLDKDVMERGFGQFAKVTEDIKKGIDSGIYKNYADGLEKVGDKYGEVALRAAASAQEAKTFTEAVDATKDAVSSGWMNTFNYIFGNYEQAKKLWTDLANIMWDIFAAPGDIRNQVLEKVMTGTFGKYYKELKAIGKPMSETVDLINKAADSLNNLDDIVSKVISGEFGNGKKRIDSLTEAGYNYYSIQNKVNESLNNSKRYSDKQIEAQNKRLKADTKVNEEGHKNLKVNAERIAQMAKMTDQELKQLGLNDEQIKDLRILSKEAYKLGMPLEDFIKNIDKINGRWVLLEAFSNVGMTLVNVLMTMRTAWRQAMFGSAKDNKVISAQTKMLWDFISALYKLTSYLKMGDETANNLRLTFKGLFSILNIVAMVLGAGLKIAATVAVRTFSFLGRNLLRVTGKIGDIIADFNKIINDGLVKGFKILSDVTMDVGLAFRQAYADAKEFITTSNIYKQFIEYLSSAYGKVKGFFGGGSKLVNQFINEIKKLDFSQVSFKKGISLIKAYKDSLIDYADSFTNGGFTKMIEACQRAIEWVKELTIKLWDWANTFPMFNKFISVLTNFYNKIKDAFQNGGKFLKDFIEDMKSLDWAKISIEDLGKVLEKYKDRAIEYFNSIGISVDNARKRLEKFREIANTAIKFMGDKAVYAKKAMIDLYNFAKQNINFATILSLGAGIAIIKFLQQLGATFDKLTAPLAGFAAAGKGVGAFFTGLGNEAKYRGITAVTKAVASLLVALAALALLDGDRLMNATKAVAAIIGSLTALTYAISQINITDVKDFTSITILLVGLSGSILLLAASVKLLADIDLVGAIKAIGLIGILTAGIIAAMWGIAKLNSTGFNKGILTFMVIAVAMRLLVGAIKNLQGVDFNSMSSGLWVMVSLLGVIGVIGLLGSKFSASAGIGLIAIVLALKMLISTLKGLADTKTLTQILMGLPMAQKIFGMFALVMMASILSGKYAARAGVGILLMSVALRLMVKVIKDLAGLDSGELDRGLSAVKQIMWIFAAITVATNFAGQNAVKAGLAIVLMAGAMFALTLVIVALQAISPEGLAKAVFAIDGIGLMFAALIAATKNASGAKTEILRLAAIMAIIALSLIALANLDKQNVAAASAGLIGVIGITALLIKATSSLSKVNGKEAFMSLLSLTALIGVIGLVVYALASIKNPQSALAATVGVGILLGALAGTMYIISEIMKKNAGFKIGPDMAKSFVAMIAIITVLGLVIAMLSSMTDPNAAVPTAIGIGLLLNAMASAMYILAYYGIFDIDLKTVGALAVMVVIVAALGLIIVELNKLGDMSNAIQTSVALSIFILALSGAMILLSIAGMGGPAALIGVGSLLAFVAGMVAVLGAIGAIVNYIPGADAAIDKGFAIFEKLAGTLGAAIHKFLDGLFFGKDSEKLTSYAQRLSDFFEGLKPVFDTVKNIPDGIADNIKNLTSALISFSKMRIADWAADLLAGDFNPQDFFKKLAAFAVGLSGFAMMTSTIKDTDHLSKVTKAAKELSVMASNLPRHGGIWQDIVGETDMRDFGLKLVAFAACLKGFAEIMAETPEDVIHKADVASEAGVKMANLANAIPKKGGIWQNIAGESDLRDFGLSLIAYGDCLKGFAGTMAQVPGDVISKAGLASEAGMKMAELAKNIPGKGTVKKLLGMEQDLKDFGNSIAAFGISLLGFSSTVGNLSEDTLGKMDTAIGAADKMATVAEKVKGIGDDGAGIMSNGGVSLASFGSTLGDFANGIAEFCGNLEGVKTTGIGSIISVADQVADIGVKASSFNESNFIKFGVGISNLGGYLDDFVQSVKGIDTKSIKQKATEIQEALGEISKIQTKGVEKVASAIKKANKDMSSAATSAATNATKALATTSGAFTNAGSSGASAYASSLSKGKTSATSAGAALGAAAVSGAKAADFNAAGKACVDGFSSGITKNLSKATSAGTALGKAALKAAKKAIDSNSPSKEFAKLGDYSAQGFALGIERMSGLAEDSGRMMAVNALDSTKSAIRRIAESVNDDIDAQPTIRPVLDLSGVSAGANQLNNMLNTSPSVGVLSSINGMMNNRQNGLTNRDVVNAINDLKSTVRQSSGDTYQINGITYDDGSNITDAVSTLVRAAKVERRI